MFRDWLFTFLFGAVTVASMLLSYFWIKFARARRLALGGKIRLDRYYMLAAAISMFAAGEALICGARTISNVRLGLPAALYGSEGLIVAIGLMIVLLGMGLLIGVADLELNPPKWRLMRWMTLAMIGWAIIAAVLSRTMPDEDRRPEVVHRG